MKKTYLTFDVEPIISSFSYNPTIYNNVILGALYIAHELRKRNQKATFFISLSSKTKSIPQAEYLDNIKLLIHALKGFENIKLAPHLHALGLEMPFKTENDFFSAYDLNQQTQLLLWAKNYFAENGVEADTFRPGSFFANTDYFSALKNAGFKYSSLMKRETEPVINALNNEIKIAYPFSENNTGIIEYPVSSVLLKSVKQKEEIIALSPDFLRLETVQDYLLAMDYININFHSFSVFSNRVARENHRNLWFNNFKFLLFERPLNAVFRKMDWEIINKNTIFRNELVKWLDFMQKNKFETFFIGE